MPRPPLARAAPGKRSPLPKGFDNAKFDYQIRLHSQRNGYRVYEIKYPSPLKTAVEQNNTVPADYYLPNDITPGDYSNFLGTVPIFTERK